MKISLTFTDLQDNNGLPELIISANQAVLYQGQVQPHMDLEHAVDSATVCLRIAQVNKDPMTDTTVVDGKIVRDKSCVLDRVIIDNYDLEELKWFSQYHTDQGETLDRCLFFGPNGTWSMEFSLPILPWILEKRQLTRAADAHWQQDYQHYLRACDLLQTLN